jgi:hypothetical protein
MLPHAKGLGEEKIIKKMIDNLVNLKNRENALKKNSIQDSGGVRA